MQSGQVQCDMLYNPIITDFVKTSHLFHVIIIELKRQKHMYSIILPESKKIMSSKITLNRLRHKGAWRNRIQNEVEKFWPPPLSLNNTCFTNVTHGVRCTFPELSLWCSMEFHIRLVKRMVYIYEYTAWIWETCILPSLEKPYAYILQPMH